MAIYTRTGDAGTTSLFTGQRVSKTHPRVEAYGTLDELNAALSLCACAAADENHRTLLEAIQQQLFGLAQSWPATASSRRPNSATSAAKRFRLWKPLSIGQWPASNRCTALFTRTLRSREPLTFARTLARRAERRLVELATEVNVRRC
ncbi:hypothetical protein JS561_04140 [Salmonella enterica subsp. enterica serovar Infantis]|nr:hypothetical protein JS561_04140 [Salmonella enterica subsp. enterica serovar Infantis]